MLLLPSWKLLFLDKDLISSTDKVYLLPKIKNNKENFLGILINNVISNFNDIDQFNSAISFHIV